MTTYIFMYNSLLITILPQKTRHIMTEKFTTKLLKDYKKPEFDIQKFDLTFNLDLVKTIVSTQIKLKKSPHFQKGDKLILNGEHMILNKVSIDSKELTKDEYELNDQELIISNIPDDEFLLEITNTINPKENTWLDGLYNADGILLTQCEAEGFRNITYFFDRPDVMTKYTVTLIADKTLYPVLLSNGNLIEKKTLEDNKHLAKWQDPFKKPAYLFAIVAGDLDHIQDSYKTKSGRDVSLFIYCEHGEADKCKWAMKSLQESMKWDENRFGLEYDLDIYNIVATRRFNMGAMENKSLNVFNSEYVFADSNTATDANFENVESVIGHEYFHNWTGNRVTCRDWFQLTLKEGLTVFRDQEFTADLRSPGVKRIKDVLALRSAQFPEDAGGMAHPIRAESYMEINNFYTSTVYNKGAEVIRMMQTILSKEGFRKGIDLYFQRHDGQAVTCEDFRSAMEDANNFKFGNFELWYSQAGTPTLKADKNYNADTKELTLQFSQSIPDTPNQTNKKPMLLPVSVALVSENGLSNLKVENASCEYQLNKDEILLLIREERESITFSHVEKHVVPSINRNFSAPIKLETSYSHDNYRTLIAHDTDVFNRYDNAQTFLKNILMDMTIDLKSGAEIEPNGDYIQAIKILLADNSIDKQFLSLALSAPSVMALLNECPTTDVQIIHKARMCMLNAIALENKDRLIEIYKDNEVKDEYSPSGIQQAMREIRNTIISLFSTVAHNTPWAYDMIIKHFDNAKTMTEKLCALSALCSHRDNPESEKRIANFYNEYKNSAEVMNKWFRSQSTAIRGDVVSIVRDLEKDEKFSWDMPNIIYASIRAFASNTLHFHKQDGSGHKLVGDAIKKLTSTNPQVASVLLNPFATWKHLGEKPRNSAQKILEEIKAQENISPNVYEKVSKYLDM